MTPTPSKPPAAPARPARDPKDSRTLEVFSRLQGGDEGCVGAFREMLDHPTAGPKLAEYFGDLGARTRELAVGLVAQTNLAIKEATPRKLAKLRAELEGPDPNPIERLLAERAAYCWLMLWEYESNLALRVKQGEMTFRQFEFHQRRIDAAHRRFCSALKTLATVRKLAVPSIQVNVGGNQVNVAGG